MRSANPVKTSPAQTLIKRLREEYRLSQTEIARRTHIPQSRISRWENGEASKGADDALRLQALLTELGGECGKPLKRSAESHPNQRATDKPRAGR